MAGRRLKHPAVLLAFGMFYLSLATAWPKFVHLLPAWGRGWLDGLHGLLFGVSIGLSLLAIRLLARCHCGA